jgi:ribosomal protein S18 acetylase RimI-like enzyme
MAALHVASWRESYRPYLPQTLVDSLAAEKRHAIWRRQIEDGQRILIAACDGDVPVAFINAGPAPSAALADADGEIAALYVLASYQRRGLGQQLMAQACAAWQARGGQSFRLGVLAHNSGSRRFYESMGGRYLRDDHYDWDGHDLPIAIYVFTDLAEIARRGGA